MLQQRPLHTSRCYIVRGNLPSNTCFKIRKIQSFLKKLGCFIGLAIIDPFWWAAFPLSSQKTWISSASWGPSPWPCWVPMRMLCAITKYGHKNGRQNWQKSGMILNPRNYHSHLSPILVDLGFQFCSIAQPLQRDSWPRARSARRCRGIAGGFTPGSGSPVKGGVSSHFTKWIWIQ